MPKTCSLKGSTVTPKQKGSAPNTRAAVLIDGKGAGSIFYLCQSDKCDVHNRVTRYQPTPQEQAQRKTEALAERVEKLSRVRILEGIRKKLPDTPSRLDLEMVALDYFRRLGHDNHRRLSKLYAWEEKKSKTSWGAETVDYEKIAAAAIQASQAVVATIIAQTREATFPSRPLGRFLYHVRFRLCAKVAPNPLTVRLPP